MIIQETGVKIIENLNQKVSDIIIGACTFSEMVLEVKECMNRLGVSILEEAILDYNEAIRDSSGRKKSWNVVRQDERKIMTPIGEVKIKRDYYRNEAATRYPNVLGCSAEGHASNILSERLSGRPKAWSGIGAEQMAGLRVFVRN